MKKEKKKSFLLHPFFFNFLFCLIVIIISWFLPEDFKRESRCGLLDIFPILWDSATESFDIRNGYILPSFASCFFMVVFWKTKAFQKILSIFQEKLKKKKETFVILITIFFSFLASFCGFYDETIYFYPILSPFFLALGLDKLLVVFCLWLGVSIGLMNPIINNRMIGHFKYINGKGNYELGITEWFFFRLFTWIILTTTLVIFNVCYSRYKKNKEQKNELLIKEEKIKKKEKITLIVAFFVFFGLATGPINWEKLTNIKYIDYLNKNTKTEFLTGYHKPRENFEVKENFEHFDEFEKNKITFSLFHKNKKKKIQNISPFGKWENSEWATICLLGGIIINLINFEETGGIIKNLYESLDKSAPMIFTYTFSNMVGIIINNYTGIGKFIKHLFLSNEEKIGNVGNAFFLISIFFVTFLICLLVDIDMTRIFIPGTQKISKDVLIHTVLIIPLARFLALSFSPFNELLIYSLKINNSSYKEYINESWFLLLFLIILVNLSIILPYLNQNSN